MIQCIDLGVENFPLKNVSGTGYIATTDMKKITAMIDLAIW